MNIQKPQKILLENLLNISDLLSLDFSDNYIKSMRDKPSFILEFFSFFFPLFGFIIYWFSNNSKPNRADLCLRYAVFGIFMNILIGIINFIGTTING